ncbi:MAG: T9SS type A sorting domain-containing protein [Melioribacteraceae bacterium]|nr:MAG: T9SS type A sorting domain-containing protein [Melioribacteraceae bacterium]
MKKLLLVILLLTSCVIAQIEDAIKVNNIYLPFNNAGILGEVNIPPLGQGGQFAGNVFLFSGGFWLSGYANDELFANGVASASLVEDYQPGTVGSSPDDLKNIIYRISENSEPFGEDWIKWKDAVEQGAYFYDGDADGIYEPVDKNSNGIWDADEDRPDLIYDELYFTVFNDGVPSSNRRWHTVNPLGIEVRQSIFGSARNSILNNTFFVRYSIVNTGLIADTLKDVIFTSWQDADVGDYIDDTFGSDSTLSSTFMYDLDNHDNDYGIPPAVYFTLVQSPKNYTGNPNDYAINKMGSILGEEQLQYYQNVEERSATYYRKSDPFSGDPNSVQEARNYSLGLNRLGDPIDPCVSNFGRPNEMAVVNCMDCEDVTNLFWVSGDPVTNCGWLSIDESDIRSSLHSNFFEMPVNEPIDIIVAYTIDQGTDGMNSLDLVRERVQYIHEEYERNFSTIVSVDDKPEEVVNEFSLSQNYPNPFNPTTTIQYTISNVGDENIRPLRTQLIVYNILGQVVKTLVNEVKAPGSYEVTFDASQLSSGVYFYRLQSGDFMQTRKMIHMK